MFSYPSAKARNHLHHHHHSFHLPSPLITPDAVFNNMFTKLVTLAALLGAAVTQQVGKETKETHPKMSWQKCSSGGSCTTVNGEVTIDSNWRWVHDKNGYSNCYNGNAWNTTICKDNKSCASNCALDGANYASTYGASTSGNALTLKFVTKGEYCM